MKIRLAGVLLVALTTGIGVEVRTSAQATPQPSLPPVDFVRDVQPIFRQHCYGCHGPTQQMNGFRLDRRRDALRGGTAVVIGPGNSEGSRLYQRLIGSHFGPQMPPTGALPSSDVALVKAWIDQGAQWPDNAAGEEAVAPANADAVRVAAFLRNGDLRNARRLLTANPALADARATGGSTPLMFAVLYAEPAFVRELLAAGANASAKNDAGATALMWSIGNIEKTRMLLERGANVNTRSDDGRTALMIAAGMQGSAETVKLLLDRGADINVVGPALYGPTTALNEAAMAGNDVVFEMLVAAGANLTAAPGGLGLSLRAGCMKCADTLMKAYPPPALTGTMMVSAPPTGPALGVPLFLERGASLDARDPEGRSILLLAAASEAMPVDTVKMLLARKMDVNERTAKGDTALGLARRHGDSPIVKLLLEAGAKDEPVPPAPTPAPAHSVRQAIERSLPLLQRTDVSFLKKSGCVSCHNNSLTSLTLAAARKAGLRVDAAVASSQTKKIGAYLETWRERALQGVSIPGEADTVSYILVGLGAEQYAPDLATDAHAWLLKRSQAADGRWRIFANRPPIESSDVQVTAFSMRALQLYAPRSHKADFDRAIAAAASWLRTAPVRTTEERASQLLGMGWSNTPKAQIIEAGRALLAEQRSDGGWAQIPSLKSDAYATGQALYSLAQSGAMTTNDPAFKRGIAFLLQTQLADGSWYVRSRAIAIQPIFDAAFPHHADAFISAAATNWATMALALGARTTS
jgi:ankyrin repeat protein